MATSVNSVCAALWWTSIRRAQRSRQPPSRDPESATQRYTGVLTAADELIGHKSLQAARSRLRAADPVVARLIDERPDFDPHAWIAQLPPMDLYGALLFQIVGQQLSVAATRRTLQRIQALSDGHLPSPAEVLAVDPSSLRAAGLSWRKIGTLRDLAERLSDGRLDEQALAALPDDDFITALTAIPGIGPWTAQGVLLVALRREDVVLPGDLALRKAIRNAYELDRLPSEQEVLALAEKWRPFRSLATSYLFASAFDRDDGEE